MSRMSFHSFDSPSSWRLITFTVIAIHVCLIALSLFVESSSPLPQQAPTRLVVQTVDLSPDTLLAFEPTPLPPNPIKRSPLPAHPLDKTPLPPTPLEHKTMPKREEQIKTPPRIPEVPPRPAPTPEPEAEVNPSDSSKIVKPVPQKTVKPPPLVPPPKKPAPIRKSQTIKKDESEKKKESAPKKKETPTKKASTPAQKNGTTPKKNPPPSTNKAIEDLKRKQEEEEATEKQRFAAETQKKKAELERQQKLIADAQEKMKKVTATRTQESTKKTTAASLSSLPNAISSLQIEALPASKGAPPLSQREATYRDELAGRLKLLLKLPEYGDVKVNLTLNRSGGVDKVVVVNTESSANRKYIEKILPTLSFPPFGANFDSLTQYTFVITLSNE